MKPYIVTYSGKLINPLDLRLEDVDIYDIAHALSHVNRFGGHCPVPISVAQHSINAAKLVEPKNHPEMELQALLHDGAEAYLGDVTKWLKGSPEMAAYREAETRAQRTIFERFSLNPEQYESVSEVDKLLVRYEADLSFGFGFQLAPEKGYGPITVEERAYLIKTLGDSLGRSAKVVKQIFLARFSTIQAKRSNTCI
jgi:hypothetical protein